MTLEAVQADQKRKESQLIADEKLYKEEKQKMEEKIQLLRTENEALKDEI